MFKEKKKILNYARIDSQIRNINLEGWPPSGWLCDWSVEDWEVDEGVSGHEEVGQQSRDGLQVADQNAADGDAENLMRNN